MSVAQLEHKVPGPARKEFETGMAEWKHGRETSAIDHLRKAIAIDPALSSGHNNLGLLLADRGDLEAAVAQFESAIGADPQNAAAYFNLARIFLKQDRPADAERAVREAMDRDHPVHADMLLLLGITLIAEGRQGDEVLHVLRKAEAERPAAHVAIAQYLAATGDRRGARQEVQEYLDSGETQLRAAAKELLAACK